MAPIDSGSFTITKSGDDYKVVVDATDDGGHAIRGEWNGPMLVLDITESASAAQMPSASCIDSGSMLEEAAKHRPPPFFMGVCREI